MSPSYQKLQPDLVLFDDSGWDFVIGWALTAAEVEVTGELENLVLEFLEHRESSSPRHHVAEWATLMD